jgi:hypothetical protein
MISATAPLPTTARTALGTRALVAAAVFAAVVSLLAMRAAPKLNVPGHPDDAHWVLRDFRDAIYYPTVAFQAGTNPYEPAAYRAAYPVGNTFPLYPPHTFLVHLPFTLVGPTTAGWLYFLTTIALTPVLAALALALAGVAPSPTRVLGVAAAILVSRPGHWNLLLGQYAVTVTIGCYLALRYAREAPGLAAVGVALAALKPTYGGPLVLLLLARGDGAAAVRGIALTALGSIVSLAWLAHAGVGPADVLAAVPANHAAFAADRSVNPLVTLYRVDAEEVLSRLLGHPSPVLALALTLGTLALAALAVHRLSAADTARARGLSASVVCLAILLCTYHQGYDLVLLALPLVFFATTRSTSPGLDRILFVLLAAPAANYLASGSALAALGSGANVKAVVGSLNAAALLAAFVVITALAFRPSRQREELVR